jgi:hypothetical protein
VHHVLVSDTGTRTLQPHTTPHKPTSCCVQVQHCMVAHSSDMQDLSQHTILRHLQDTTLPLPLCHHSSIPRSITPETSLSCLINADGLITTCMHHYCCMVGHSLDIQDPSLHTIPRHLQDTALPVSLCHYSSISQCITPESSVSCLINANGPPTVHMHHHHHMVAHSLDMQDPSPHMIPRHLQDTALPVSPYHCSYILQCTTPDSSLIATPMDSLPHTDTITVTPELLPHDSRL